MSAYISAWYSSLPAMSRNNKLVTKALVAVGVLAVFAEDCYGTVIK